MARLRRHGENTKMAPAKKGGLAEYKAMLADPHVIDAIESGKLAKKPKKAEIMEYLNNV